MQFKISIKSMRRHAIDLETMALGLTELDHVRSELKLPNMSADRLCDTVELLHTDVICDVTEDLARVSGHFKTHHTVVVSAPSGFLNDFVDTVGVAACDAETGAILEVVMTRVVSKARILAAWCEAGYPLDWGFTDDKVA